MGGGVGFGGWFGLRAVRLDLCICIMLPVELRAIGLIVFFFFTAFLFVGGGLLRFCANTAHVYRNGGRANILRQLGFNTQCSYQEFQAMEEELEHFEDHPH
jgi:hypothetical protein